MLRDEGRDGKKARDGGEEEKRGVRGEGCREEQREQGEGDYKPGSREDRKGSKRKWEREREGVMGLESMHELAGNGWSG